MPHRYLRRQLPMRPAIGYFLSLARAATPRCTLLPQRRAYTAAKTVAELPVSGPRSSADAGFELGRRSAGTGSPSVVRLRRDRSLG